MAEATIELPAKLKPVFAPERGAVRYRCAYGGRGSGKSFNFARMATVFGVAEPLRILCCREIQTSIRESFLREVKRAIRSKPFLSNFYTIGHNFVRGLNGTEFIFHGLRHNLRNILSMSDLDLVIVEEAEDVPEEAWIQLVPTVRKPKSEIWAIWNPKRRGSPVDHRFRQNVRDDAVVAELNWRDNPWFPEVLNRERLHALENMDPMLYAWIWEGAYYEISEALVFNRWSISTFEPGEGWYGPYQGLDFGFASDPTAVVRCWVADHKLYIDYAASKVGLELDHTVDWLKRNVPGIERYTCRADSSRPESISYLKRHGLPLVTPTLKWSGSIEGGIVHIKSYREIVVHPRCGPLIEELRSYKYKTDKLTGDVLPVLEGGNDHCIDAMRYALEPLIRRRRWRPAA